MSSAATLLTLMTTVFAGSSSGGAALYEDSYVGAVDRMLCGQLEASPSSRASASTVVRHELAAAPDAGTLALHEQTGAFCYAPASRGIGVHRFAVRVIERDRAGVRATELPVELFIRSPGELSR